MRLKFILGLLLVTTFFGCDKKQDPEPEPASKVFDFSFRHDSYFEEIKELELVVSQKDGKVLLDTMLATGIDHALRVKSNDPKFDFTLLSFSPSAKKYFMYTYIQENRTKWHINHATQYPQVGKTEPATIHYYNAPLENHSLFQAKMLRGGGSTSSGNELTIHYERLLPTDLVYVLLPSHKKYMFTEITSADTQIDFSKANTAGVRKFNKPAGVTNFSSRLLGSTKAGDLSTLMFLYLPYHTSNDYDLQFPTTGIEEFVLSITYTDEGGYYHSYDHKGTTVPASMDFAAASDFTVTKAEADDFQIQFGNDKPDSYETLLEADYDNSKAAWLIYSSPEETALKPKTFLENLKPKMLASKQLSLIKLQTVQSLKALKSSENGARQSRSILKAFR